MAKSFEDLLSLVNARFYRSNINIKLEQEKPTFFYHVKKTGGMSFFYSFLSADIVNAKLPQLKKVNTYKYDDLNSEDASFSTPMTNKTLFMSHLSWGAHKRFNQDMHLVTMLRDPFKRALSNYTYSCMRNQQPSTIEGFKAYYTQTDNINVMNKQLTPTPEHFDAEKTFKHLEDNFRYFGTTEHISLYIEHYLSEYGLPNVLMGQMNETLPEYKLVADVCKEEFMLLNEEDIKLYQLVNSNPRIPNPVGENSNVNGLTALQFEIEKELKSLCESHVISTQVLYNYLARLDAQFNGSKKINVSQMIG